MPWEVKRATASAQHPTAPTALMRTQRRARDGDLVALLAVGVECREAASRAVRCLLAVGLD